MFEVTRKRKIAILIGVDSLLLFLANIATIRFMKPFAEVSTDFMFISTGVSIGFYLFYGSLFKVFTRINRYMNLEEIRAIFVSLSITMISNIFVLFFYQSSVYVTSNDLYLYFVFAFNHGKPSGVASLH